MKRRKSNTDIHTECHVKMKAEMGVMHYNPRNAKDCQHNTGS